MHRFGWIVVALAILEGGWFAYDGAHALIKGDYVTPKSGKYAGQLGPWSKIVSAIGIPPRSTLMKWIHVALGSVWLVTIVAYIMSVPNAGWGMMACAILGLWYLPFGTILSLIQIGLLSMASVRGP